MSATWGNSENIYSLGVLPPLTRTGRSWGQAFESLRAQCSSPQHATATYVAGAPLSSSSRIPTSHDLQAQFVRLSAFQTIKTAASRTASGGAGSPHRGDLTGARSPCAPRAPARRRRDQRTGRSSRYRCDEPASPPSDASHRCRRESARSVMDVVADRLGAGEPLRAQSDRACVMLRLRNAMRHRPGFLVTE